MALRRTATSVLVRSRRACASCAFKLKPDVPRRRNHGVVGRGTAERSPRATAISRFRRTCQQFGVERVRRTRMDPNQRKHRLTDFLGLQLAHIMADISLVGPVICPENPDADGINPALASLSGRCRENPNLDPALITEIRASGVVLLNEPYFVVDMTISAIQRNGVVGRGHTVQVGRRYLHDAITMAAGVRTRVARAAALERQHRSQQKRSADLPLTYVPGRFSNQ